MCLLRENIISFMYKSFPNRAGNPIFSIYDRLDPIVTTKKNFDRFGTVCHSQIQLETSNVHLVSVYSFLRTIQAVNPQIATI